MALQTLALLVLAQSVSGRMTSHVNRTATFIRSIPIRKATGKNVSWSAKGAGATAQDHTEGHTATSNQNSDVQRSAILSFGLYDSQFSRSDLAMSAAAAQGEPTGNIEIYKEGLIESSNTLLSALNVGMYTHNGVGASSGGPALVGLDTALADGNTYATIDRTSGPNAFWKAMVKDPGSPTAITAQTIRLDISTIAKNSGQGRPDLALVGTSTYQSIAGSFDNVRDYTQSVYTTARGEITLDGSVDAIRFNGCTFIEDKDCPEGSIYYLNTNFVHIEVLPKPQGPGVQFNYDLAANDGLGNVPLMFSYKPLASSGSSEAAMVDAQIQLVVERPNACGVRRNVLFV